MSRTEFTRIDRIRPDDRILNVIVSIDKEAFCSNYGENITGVIGEVPVGDSTGSIALRVTAGEAEKLELSQPGNAKMYVMKNVLPFMFEGRLKLELCSLSEISALDKQMPINRSNDVSTYQYVYVGNE